MNDLDEWQPGQRFHQCECELDHVEHKTKCDQKWLKHTKTNKNRKLFWALASPFPLTTRNLLRPQRLAMSSSQPSCADGTGNLGQVFGANGPGKQRNSTLAHILCLQIFDLDCKTANCLDSQLESQHFHKSFANETRPLSSEERALAERAPWSNPKNESEVKSLDQQFGSTVWINNLDQQFGSTSFTHFLKIPEALSFGPHFSSLSRARWASSRSWPQVSDSARACCSPSVVSFGISKP